MTLSVVWIGQHARQKKIFPNYRNSNYSGQFIEMHGINWIRWQKSHRAKRFCVWCHLWLILRMSFISREDLNDTFLNKTWNLFCLKACYQGYNTWELEEKWMCQIFTFAFADLKQLVLMNMNNHFKYLLPTSKHSLQSQEKNNDLLKKRTKNSCLAMMTS